ncbi:unnamed protein product [Caenorhabditis auriculariae]|uniref:Uncharacterized protein n=1 Tax=Caenorhabditis auriculariae TaxID=2777116 RepID=A0A8S1GW29_9PELO|nr:unnamed protein product [Caenorhabditis auriculariae]
MFRSCFFFISVLILSSICQEFQLFPAYQQALNQYQRDQYGNLKIGTRDHGYYWSCESGGPECPWGGRKR